VSELTHLDDFVLLRYVAGDLDEEDRGAASRHLEVCPACSRVEREIAELDGELRRLAGEKDLDAESPRLGPGDPFRSRPPGVFRRIPRDEGAGLAATALEASERALALSERLLESTRDPRILAEELFRLSLADVSHRFALLYALQESGRRIAEGPVRFLRFAEEALARLRREPFSKGAGEPEAERIVPKLILRGQAHLLAGQACNWTREFERARTHLELAYRSFARGGADETSLAIVEHIESQRRSFLGKGKEALILARRAAATFEQLGLEDLSARSRVAEANALFMLDRLDEAVEVLRNSLPVFEKHGLWSNYVGALNNLGATLAKAARLDDARREYARALRRLSRERDRPFVAYIRHGLAEVLFAAGRYREAAISLAQAARLYRECGLAASALMASLFEVESWARQGDLGRARHRLDLFLAEVGRQGALDPSLTGEIEQALSGGHADLGRVADLRHRTEAILQERLGLAPA
jgi:tetratricopeptide (TPR) repeat protein